MSGPFENLFPKNSWIYQHPGPAIKKVFTGDRELAIGHLGIGMAMLRYVKENMQRNLFTSFSMENTLPDGTIVQVSSIFGQDQIFINAPITAIEEKEKKDLRIKIMYDGTNWIGVNELYPIDFRVVMADGLLYNKDSLVWFYTDDGFWTIRKRNWIPYIDPNGIPDKPIPVYEFYSAKHPMPDPNIPVIILPGYGHYDETDTIGISFEEGEAFWVVYRSAVSSSVPNNQGGSDTRIVHAQYPNRSIPDMFFESSGRIPLTWYNQCDLISVGDYIDYPNIIIFHTQSEPYLPPSDIHWILLDTKDLDGRPTFVIDPPYIGGSGAVLTYKCYCLYPGNTSPETIQIWYPGNIYIPVTLPLFAWLDALGYIGEFNVENNANNLVGAATIITTRDFFLSQITDVFGIEF